MKAVICEYHTWNSIYKIGNHHYARAMMNAGWDVLWVSHPISPFHGLKAANRERMEVSRSGGIKHDGGLVEIIPNTKIPFLKVPVLESRWVLEKSLYNCTPSMESLLDKHGFMEPDLLWVTDTSMHSMVEISRPKVTAVRIADDNIKFSDMPESLVWAEEKLCGQADVVYVTSAPLFESHEKKYPGVVRLLRNGVDYDHFQGDFEVPVEYKDFDGPVVVYVGAIEEWFEFDWIKKLGNERKDARIVVIGKYGKVEEISGFEKMSNVIFPGPKPYDKIPAYLNHSDAAVIPFKRTPLIESVSPIKMFEYLASGLPVVCTSWKELENLGSPAVLVSDGDEFVASVSGAIDGKFKVNRGLEYREYAKENSWASRFDDALKVLEPFLE